MEAPNSIRAPSPLPENAATMNCSCSKTLGRNLVVCIDGTSNKLGKKNTNVIELYGLLEKDTNQVTFYNSGIGTFAKPSWKSLTYLRHAIGHKLDLAIAWDFEKIVILAYRWLSDNYQPNDRIFLFGFSRGAYQVRCLSAMIKTVGLIYRGNEAQIPFAYELYAAITENEDSEANLLATRFRNEFSRAVNVHFVGAWDTVSSVGILRSKSLPRTTTGMGHVCYFRHALALDERRVKFLPEYAHGGSALPDHSQVISDSNPADDWSPDDPPRIKEVWFAGTHSDIGGRRVIRGDLDQNEPPLQWMASEATAVGLKTVSVRAKKTRDMDLQKHARDVNVELKMPDPASSSVEQKVDVHKSLTCVWWLLEIMPWRRLSYQTSKKETMVPHLGRGRFIRAGQKIHSSVKSGSRAHKTILQMMGDTSADTAKKHVVGATAFRVSSNYTPKASIRVEDRLDEIEFRRFLSPEEKFEPDLSDLALELVEKLSSMQQSGEPESQEFRSRVRSLYYSPDGPELMHRLGVETFNLTAVEEMTKTDKYPDLQLFVLASFIEGFRDDRLSPRFRNLYMDEPKRIRPLIFKLLSKGTSQHRENALTFLRSKLVLEEESKHHPLRISDGQGIDRLCVAASPYGNYYVIGSNDHTLSIFLSSTEKVTGPKLTGHTLGITSACFSADEKFIASGSYDKTLRVWDTASGKDLFGPLEGHTAMVGAVTFSKHGNLLASGSHDSSIRLWDATTGKARVTLQGQKSPVLSLAFSNAKEDLMLASGSSNNTICLWLVQTATTILTFEGHEDGVVALAFAPNDGHIVSGSFDKTIRVWSTKTGKAIGAPLTGHTDTVSSVGFSYDAKWIISGSFDRTIRIWEGQTSEEKQFVEIYKFEPNHGDWIGSAALLPGGEYIVSASLNGTYQSRNIKTRAIEKKPFLGHSAASRCARFSPDGKRIVSCSDDGTIRFWDAETGAALFKPQWHKGTVYHVEYFPDGKKLFSAGADWTVQIWNAHDGTMDGEAFRGHSTVVRAVAHSAEANQLVSASDDGTIRVWNLDISDGEDRLAFPAWEDAGITQSIDFSVDGDYIVSGLEDGRVRLWSTVTRVAVHEWKGTEGRVYSVKFCPDGRSILAGATDGTIHVWDFKGNSIGKFRGHSGPVFIISFSPHNSNRLVSGSADQSIIVWDFAAREKIGEPWRGHNGAVWSVAFSPDGKEVVSASEDSTIRIWDVASGHPVDFPPLDLPTIGHKRLIRRDGKRDITLPGQIDWGLLGIGAKDLLRLGTWLRRSLVSQLWSMIFDSTD